MALEKILGISYKFRNFPLNNSGYIRNSVTLSQVENFFINVPINSE